MTLDFNTDTEQGRKKIEEEFNRLYQNQNVPNPVPANESDKPSNALLALLAVVILCLIVYVAL